MRSDQQRRIGVATLALLALAFVAAVIVNNSLFRGIRLDLTENRLYTLSDGTRSLVTGIDEPINLYFFFSEQELDNDEQFLRGYARRVRDMLEEFAAESNGNLVLSTIDPAPFSEDEDRASQFGLEPVSAGGLGESIYFGLVGTNSVGDEDTISFFQPSKENFLEYDIARLVYNLANPIKTKIGLFTSLPVGGGFDPRTQQPSKPWVVVQQAQQLFDVETLPDTLTEVPEDIDVLWIIHPAMPDQETLYAIDQFVMRGGRALIFVDPVAEVAGGGPSPADPLGGQSSSTLGPLFDAWGIEFDPSRAVVDDALALQINTGGLRPTRHIGLLGLDASVMDQDDVVTAGLQSINVGVAGAISLSDESTLTLTPLLQSSHNSGMLPAAQFQFLQNPEDLYKSFTPTPEQYTIAARLQGPLKTAFPDGPPEQAADDEGGAPPAAAPLTETDSANLLLVADVDILSDRLWVRAQSFLGQQLVTAFASNGDFLINALDNLTGSAELIGLRSRASFSRPFDRVEALRVEADARFRATEEQLQAELADTERRLGELQAARGDNQSLLMTPEQQTELQRFLDQQVEIRQELRAVRRNLDRDIERLGTTLKVINIGLIPFALVVFLLVRFLWQRGHRGQRK
jgi:gliding motility-associatede transport system auxiliary component